ncbi:FadR/GntR family transcriptional regulator [Aeromicrobium wangtongii]|uniref:FCD domain-containing protein n=1 Tax=Aeromicrobium wangtongii TaxID=2969247 RepID=A0ABY5M9J0_9ACTN|nr:FCD domain-containing protein [Aeromicrobium wangtongii]MCD9196981.1 FCD domain-containing protein [Aeromicrobium wangtongii]UUP14482.1 FCD domain-containing protein [Aeromicrobium wangtongii]
MANERVKHVRVADTLADDLRTRIFSGALKDGRLPPQHQLAEEAGVGLVSVREALRILESEGLIFIKRGNQGGAEIRRPDPRTASFSLGLVLQSTGTTLAELSAALRAFEPYCARMCAGSDDCAQIADELEHINDELSGLIDDANGFTPAARRFHARLVELCPNRAVALVVQSLVDLWSIQEDQWARRMNDARAYPGPKYRIDVVSVHGRLIQAIRDGDEDEAERTASSHLHATQLYVMQGREPEGVRVT